MTPVANSCCAFSKLAPVVRYSAWTWREERENRWSSEINSSEEQLHRHGDRVICPPGTSNQSERRRPRLTFLNIMSEQTESAVKSAAISSMMMPTGTLVFSPVSAAIQPLATHKQRHGESGRRTGALADVHA